MKILHLILQIAGTMITLFTFSLTMHNLSAQDYLAEHIGHPRFGIDWVRIAVWLLLLLFLFLIWWPW